MPVKAASEMLVKLTPEVYRRPSQQISSLRESEIKTKLQLSVRALFFNLLCLTAPVLEYLIIWRHPLVLK